MGDLYATQTFRSATIGSVATDSSTYFPIVRVPAFAQIMNARFINGTVSSATSGTSGSTGIIVNLYKNAYGTASLIGSFNGSGTAVATLASATLVTSSTANARCNAGDLLIGEVVGGADNNGSQAGAFIEVDFLYGDSSKTTPTAGTGPA